MVKSVDFFFQIYNCFTCEFFFVLVKSCTFIFAAHHKERYVPRSFKVAIDQLFDNLESGKKNLSIVLEKSLEFWIQRSVRTLHRCGNNNALYPIICRLFSLSPHHKKQNSKIKTFKLRPKFRSDRCFKLF